MYRVAKNTLCLDLGAGYTGIYMCVNSTSCIISYFTLLYAVIPQLKKCTQNKIRYIRTGTKIKSYPSNTLENCGTEDGDKRKWMNECMK